MSMDKLSSALLDWYKSVRRDLPWRRSEDPYHIWVSEIMLQQTRVEAVIPYYNKFVERYPDMGTLAVAPEDELISTWQGLGYYSRARNLQRGVREVLSSYGGKLPDQLDQVRALPGIGPYTAGALLSIAYGKKEPAVDGNVLRVISRLFDIREPVQQTSTQRRIEETVRQLIPDNQPGEFNQALMELGALLCIPRNPRCGECPLQEICRARLAGVQCDLPVRRPPTRQAVIHVWTGILGRQDKILVRPRPNKGLLAGMWECPSVERASALADEETMEKALLAEFLKYDQQVRLLERWQQVTHEFSHRQWIVSVWRCKASKATDILKGDARWISLQEAEQFNWGGPYRKIIADWVADNKKG